MLALKKTFSIPIDSVTSNVVAAYDYLNSNKGEYFTFLNRNNNSIYYFNLNTQKYDKVRKFENQGPNGVGDFNTTTRYMLKGDSVIFYDRQYMRLVIVNDDNDVVSKFNFKEVKESPYGRLGDWMILEQDGSFNFSTSAVRLSYVEVIDLPDSLEMTYNPRTQEYGKAYLPLPAIYLNKKWITEHLFYHRAHSEKDQRSVYSFPVDENIYYKGSDGVLKSKYMGSDKLNSIESMPSMELAMDFEKKLKYYFVQGRYDHLYYDPYRDIYLRFALSPLNENKFDMNDPMADTSAYDQMIILADNELNKIGEFQNDMSMALTVFFRQDGIYIMRRAENEDELIFDVYDLEN
tara:strand:- start:2728 stop:3771 length:1044 start_codon:yes stop_codon:yes gene_type:complete